MKALGIPLIAAALALATGGALAQPLQDLSPADRSRPYDSASKLWQDNWGSDRYGYFDEDFNWKTGIEERERWSTWYGRTDLGWNDWYDDVGDETLFEVGPDDGDPLGIDDDNLSGGPLS